MENGNDDLTNKDNTFSNYSTFGKEGFTTNNTNGGEINHSFELNESNVDTEKDKHQKTLTHESSNALQNDLQDTSNQENVDFETAIEKTGFGKFNVLLLILALPATCASTFDTASLPFALPTASCDLNLTGYDRGLLNGAVYAGMISSSFIWGYLSDSLGRKKLLALGYLMDACFSIGSSLSQNKWAIFAFKYLSGCAISGPFSMILTYMSEMFGKKYRDSIILSSGIYTSLGGVVQPIIALAVIPKIINLELFNGLIKINSWRLFLLLSAAPALTSGILTLFCLESPKFLLSKGRKDEALKVFQYMYSKNTGRPADTYPVKSLQDEQTQGKEVSSNSNFFYQIASAFRHPHLKHTFLCCGVQFLALNSLNTIRLWLPQLFFYIETIGDETMNTCQVISRNIGPQPIDCSTLTVNESVYIHVMYTNFTTAMCMALSSYLVKKTGKKVLIVSSFIISALLVVSVPWVNASYTVWVVCLYSGVISVASIGIVGLAVELFPTSIRTLAVSLTMTFGRTGVVIGSITLPFLLNLTCWTPFITVGFLCIISGTTIFLAVDGRKEKVKQCPVVSP